MNILSPAELAHVESILAPYVTYYEGDEDSNTYAVHTAIPESVADAAYDFMLTTHGDISIGENYVIIWVYID